MLCFYISFKILNNIVLYKLFGVLPRSLEREREKKKEEDCIRLQRLTFSNIGKAYIFNVQKILCREFFKIYQFYWFIIGSMVQQKQKQIKRVWCNLQSNVFRQRFSIQRRFSTTIQAIQAICDPSDLRSKRFTMIGILNENYCLMFLIFLLNDRF